MKLATVSVSAPRIMTRLPSPLKLASSGYSSKRKMKQEPLLLERGELSDGSSGWDSRNKVPKGSIAVYVGRDLRRFVIPISFLAMPEFRVLLEKVADEYGCDHDGAIEIPCDEDRFERILMDCFSRQRNNLSSSNIPKKLGNMRRLIYV